MKKYVLFIVIAVAALAGALAWLLVGCSDQTTNSSSGDNQNQRASGRGASFGSETLFEVATSQGAAAITQVNVDQAVGSIEFPFLLQRNDGVVQRRILAVQINQNNSGEVFMTTNLSDSVGVSLSNFSIKVSRTDSARKSIDIITPTRHISFESIGSDSIIREVYAVDGERHVYEFPKSMQQRFREICYQARETGGFDLSLVTDRQPGDKVIIGILSDYQAFYNRTDSLIAGPNFSLSTELLSNSSIQQHIWEDIIGGGEVIQSFWTWLCRAAAACAFVACEFGPNPVCTGCGAVALICAFMDGF
jgi:hypothetical protein